MSIRYWWGQGATRIYPGFRGVMENMTAPYIYVVAEDWTTKQPTLYRARIVKETPKQIRTERTGAAFLCKTQFDRAALPEVKRTPREAWEAYSAAREQAVAQLRQALARAEEQAQHAAGVLSTGAVGEGVVSIPL